MFFLLRVAFWLTLVLILLPSIPGLQLSQPHAPGPSAASGAAPVDPLQALSAAGSAMSDARGFCDRQPQACAIGSEIATTLGTRAEAGARLLLNYIGEQITEQKRKVAERANANAPGDTLTAHDLSPAWQAPANGGVEAENATIFGPPVAAPATAPATASPAVPTPPRRPS
ncbi:DUF5330 domain-containing protein [Ancylobacter sonchi]|uniref:DUF5330 domain-containing protein n=1 Tax=Ancylobacter sonchi TaxID=1937790 RepID=UPI001BD52140|nr:DUF5330 domain-containing protein [Ancylobacter sonchi]MBS7537198.1 DUF5330 domain-containing protein [Ancylobacter sonchi]